MNNNFRIFLKRGAAYLIDIVIIFIIGTVIASLPVFNKYNKKYDQVYNELLDFSKSNDEINKLFKDSYSDGIISQEEYDKLILFDDYKDLIIVKYDDGEIDKNEYQSILKEIKNLYDEKGIVFNYKLKKNSINNTIITLGTMLGYFGILQFLMNGQTIGKKIMNLRVVTLTGDKVVLGWMIIRCLIVNNILLNTINLGCLLLLKMGSYNQVTSIIDLIISIVEAVIIYLIITRNDSRGLHDLVAKTQVIINEKIKVKDKSKNKILDGEYVEK